MLSFWVCWFTVWVIQLWCFSWPWETRIPVVEAEHWTPPPGLVYLSSHNALGQEGDVGLFRRTTAGILQPNGHVFTLGCFLISHCNENNIKKKKKIDSFLLGPLFSKQSNSASIIRQIFQISSECLSTEWSSGYWLTRHSIKWWIIVDHIILEGTVVLMWLLAMAFNGISTLSAWSLPFHNQKIYIYVNGTSFSKYLWSQTLQPFFIIVTFVIE